MLQSVYLINCLYKIRSAVVLFEFADARKEMLEAQIEAHTSTVVLL